MLACATLLLLLLLKAPGPSSPRIPKGPCANFFWLSSSYCIWLVCFKVVYSYRQRLHTKQKLGIRAIDRKKSAIMKIVRFLGIFLQFILECFHMTSRPPCWMSETKKQRPCWRSEIFFWELNSIFMQILPFVLVWKYCCWSHE